MYTVLDGRAHIDGACIFFAMTGAAILRKHYRLDAAAISGAAAYVVNSQDAIVATFGKVDGDTLTASPDAFHCWVECNGYVIDFMSPVFQENLRTYSGCTSTIPRRMLQKPIAQMTSVSSLSSNPKEGAFCLVQSTERTESMKRSFSSKPSSGDFANICDYWYRRPPKNIDGYLDMRNDLGEVVRLALHGPEINGSW